MHHQTFSRNRGHPTQTAQAPAMHHHQPSTVQQQKIFDLPTVGNSRSKNPALALGIPHWRKSARRTGTGLPQSKILSQARPRYLLLSKPSTEGFTTIPTQFPPWQVVSSLFSTFSDLHSYTRKHFSSTSQNSSQM